MTIWLVTADQGERLIQAASKAGAKIMARQLGGTGGITARPATLADRAYCGDVITVAEFNEDPADPKILELLS